QVPHQATAGAFDFSSEGLGTVYYVQNSPGSGGTQLSSLHMPDGRNFDIYSQGSLFPNQLENIARVIAQDPLYAYGDLSDSSSSGKAIYILETLGECHTRSGITEIAGLHSPYEGIFLQKGLLDSYTLV